MNTQKNSHERGAVSGSLIALILLIIVVLGLAGLSIWLYTQYSGAKTNLDGKISVAVADAKREQAEAEQKKFLEREKEPNRQFVGPDDYGRLTFNYPKTWSVYIGKDGSDDSGYEAYLNPSVVPPIDKDSQRFAMRVKIENQDYNAVVSSYDDKVKEGDLKSSATSSNGLNGTRLDGSFDENIRGAVVIYKVRDKTISIFTDADTFKPDFETIIKTIKVNE